MQGSRIQLPSFAPMIKERNSDNFAETHNHLYRGGSDLQAQPAFDGNTMRKNGTNRIRVRKACDRCKKQKTKCNGEIPCLTCEKHGHKCEYSVPTPNSTSGDTGTEISKNSVTNDEYTKYLELKIKSLERYIDTNQFDAKRNNEIFKMNQFCFSKDKYRVMRRYQNILPHELGKSIFTSLNNEQNSDLIVPRIQFYGWNMSGGHYLKQRALPDWEPLIDLVQDLDLGNWLVDFFMVKINPLFSIIHEKVFRDQYNNYVVDLQNTDSSKTTRLFSSILYLIFAISIRYSENDPDTPLAIKSKCYPNLEEKLFDSAYDVVSRLSFEWQSFELIQSWILITFFLRTTYRQNASYMSLGTAIRMCKGMSLNVNIIPETMSKKPYEKLKTRRIFWLVYTWDRLHAFQSGKDYDLDEGSVLQDLPSLHETVNELDKDGWLSKPSLAMIHLAQIAGAIQQHYNVSYTRDSGFKEKINSDLQKWKIWFDQNNAGYDTLLIDQVYLTYHDIVLNFNNKALFKLIDKPLYIEGDNNEIQTLLYHSFEVLQIFQKLHEDLHLAVPWWMNLVLLFNIALIHIVLINSGVNNSNRNLNGAMVLLKSLENKTGMAKECVWALKMLNHMCYTRMAKSIKLLTSVGIDHGSDLVNRVKFLQFGKVDDVVRKRTFTEEEDANDDFDLGNVEGLLGNLKWFDQWVSEFDK